MAIQASKPNSRVFLLLGVLLAALAFGGVLFALRQSSGNGIGIVVTKVGIPAGTTLTADMVTTSSVPASAAPADAFTASSSVVGKTTTVAVAQNTPLVPAFFAAQPLAAATTTTSNGTSQPVSVESQITKGYVAVAIPTTSVVPAIDGATTDAQKAALNGDLVSTGYYIQPGDHIDMLISTGGTAPVVRYAFQDVPVLRVGDNGAASSGSPTVLVVEVPRNQAQMFTALTASLGHPYVLRYVLRPQSEWGKLAPDNSSYAPNYEPGTGQNIPAPADTPVSPGDLDALFGH